MRNLEYPLGRRDWRLKNKWVIACPIASRRPKNNDSYRKHERDWRRNLIRGEWMDSRMQEKAKKLLKDKTIELFAQASYFITFSLFTPCHSNLYRFVQGI